MKKLIFSCFYIWFITILNYSYDCVNQTFTNNHLQIGEPEYRSSCNPRLYYLNPNENWIFTSVRIETGLEEYRNGDLLISLEYPEGSETLYFADYEPNKTYYLDLVLPSNFCYNQKFDDCVKIKYRARIVPKEGAQYHEFNERFIRVLKDGPSNCGNYSILTRGSIGEQVNLDLQGFLAPEGSRCRLPTGAYPGVTRYRIDWYVNDNFSATPSLEYSKCIGYSFVNPENYQDMWGGVDNVTQNSAHFYTYVYFVLSGVYSGYWPCTPQNAVIAYVKRPAAPIIVTLSPPGYYCYKGQIKTVRPYSSGATIYEWCWKRCQEPNLTCYPYPQGVWSGVHNPHHGIWYGADSRAFYFNNVNYNNEECSEPPDPIGPINQNSNLPHSVELRDEEDYKIYLRYQACNIAGCSEWSYNYTSIVFKKDLPPPPPGGCPYISVQNEIPFFSLDNNILHKSEFPENYDSIITDKYLLKVPLEINEGKCNLEFNEMGNDISYFDQIKLYAVDHLIGTKLAITEDNELLTYDGNMEIISSDNATLNNEDITERINYYYRNNEDTLRGDTLDYLYAHYSNNLSNNRAIIGEISQNHIIYPTVKDYVGNIRFNGIFQSFGNRNFSRRENKSDFVIPISDDWDQIDNIEISWLKGYELKYLVLASVSYDNFSVTEFDLSEVFSSDYDSLTDLKSVLKYKDGISYILNNNKDLVLSFDNINNYDPTVKRDYIIEVNGKYLRSDDDNRNFSKLNNPLIPIKFTLQQNYPNPFNPLTKIKYSIGKQTLVKLIIYDILGREVKIIVNEIKEPGFYESV